MVKCDFSGYATRNDLLCGDGRTIRKDAFKENDGCEVPLIWNHEHNDPNAVLGHAVLENREDGVYAYGVFNDTEQGQTAKKLVQNGDVRSLSIWANQLKHIGKDVIHGNIRELSLVLAGANPGAYVDFIMAHSADGEEELEASWDENIMLYHSADTENNQKGDSKVAEEKKNEGAKTGEKTIKEILGTLNEEQKDAVAAVVGMALEGNGVDDSDDDDEEGGKVVKHNVFDNKDTEQGTVLSHSDEQRIISMAKQSNVGTLKQAMEIFAEENSDTLAHGVFDDEVEALFPEYELLKKGEPDTLERDQTWIDSVMSKIHKSPYSRIRTRQADARIADLRAKGYQKKGNYKEDMAKIKLLSRTTDPQTVYIKDQMHRDDVVDITDFDVVAYQWKMMRHVLNIKCMTITKNVPSEVYDRISKSQTLIDQISAYIDDPMTATTFRNDPSKRGSREVITAELIYYWMISQGIPVEFEKWHINSLLTLIRVCNVKNSPGKKMSAADITRRNEALNKARRAKHHSKG